MEARQLRQTILNELPALMQNDLAFREVVLEISSVRFANKAETDTRFDIIVARLDSLMDENHKQNVALNTGLQKLEQRLDRKIDEDHKKWEENNQKWEENHKQLEENHKQWEEKWEENQRRWDENQKQIVALNTAIQNLEQRLDRKINEDRKKWEENQRRWDENQKQIVALNTAIQNLEQRLDRKIDEDRKKWEENQRRWDENQKQIVALNTATQNLDKKYERLYTQSIGAVGARWGIQSEASFRNALAGILREFPDVQVTHVTEKDESGMVFGRPDQVELDLIIKNGVLMICEIKSSISKSEMYTFDKKVRFYEQKHGRQANRKIVISPMLDPYAKPVADNLGIEVYSYADDINLS